MYKVNYGTGAGNFAVNGTFEQAKAEADEGAAYTQESITIQDENGNDVSERRWWGVEYDPEVEDASEDEIIAYGKFGYYGAWCDL